MVATDDHALLERLARTDRKDWMVRAVDDHAITVPFIAAYLGISRRTTYRRLQDQRHRGDSPVSASDGTPGTVP